jgi:AraC-like DNA-binding protein
MTPSPSPILDLSDAGHSPASIASQTNTPLSSVYATLLLHRPDRPRARRQRTSELRSRIVALLDSETPKQIAEAVGCSRAYVYRILKETR